MLLFASFLTRCDVDQRYIAKGVSSAKQTIELIHEIYRHHEYFQTWYVPHPLFLWQNRDSLYVGGTIQLMYSSPPRYFWFTSYNWELMLRSRVF